MTLVVATDEDRDEHRCRRDAGVDHARPSEPRDRDSRARPPITPDLDAQVLAQCWMPFGKRQQICCEQIEILTDEKGLLDVAPVVQTLRVADLPVVLWCRASKLLDLPDFQPVLELSSKLILDSGRHRRSRRPNRTAAAFAQRRTPGRRSGLDTPHPMARIDCAGFRQSRLPGARRQDSRSPHRLRGQPPSDVGLLSGGVVQPRAGARAELHVPASRRRAARSRAYRRLTRRGTRRIDRGQPGPRRRACMPAAATATPCFRSWANMNCSAKSLSIPGAIRCTTRSCGGRPNLSGLPGSCR